MRVHVFESMTEPDLYGFTSDRSGNNLPPRGEWKYFKTIDVAVGETGVLSGTQVGHVQIAISPGFSSMTQSVFTDLLSV